MKNVELLWNWHSTEEMQLGLAFHNFVGITAKFRFLDFKNKHPDFSRKTFKFSIFFFPDIIVCIHSAAYCAMQKGFTKYENKIQNLPIVQLHCCEGSLELSKTLSTKSRSVVPLHQWTSYWTCIHMVNYRHILPRSDSLVGHVVGLLLSMRSSSSRYQPYNHD